jgi:hypothetical protein
MQRKDGPGRKSRVVQGGFDDWKDGDRPDETTTAPNVIFGAVVVAIHWATLIVTLSRIGVDMSSRTGSRVSATALFPALSLTVSRRNT